MRPRFPRGEPFRKCVPCRRLTHQLTCDWCGQPTRGTTVYNVQTVVTVGTPDRPVFASSPGERFGLAPRETEVMELIVGGMEQSQVAVALGISPWTVKALAAKARRKMGVSNRVEAARVWWET